MRRALRGVALRGVALRGGALCGAVSAVAVFGLAGGASAHVTVGATDATQGGQARIVFTVPDESDTTSTTKVEVNLPADQPVASVLVEPVAGWTATLTTTKLAAPITTDDGDKVTEAVTLITWAATSADTAIKPGQFLEFPVSLGPLPKTPTMVFKVLQTYSDTTVVRWIDEPQAGQPEPDHPAPVLKLTAATATDAAATAGTSSTPVAKSTTGGSATTAALTVGITGGVLGLIGAILGAMALTRSRRPA